MTLLLTVFAAITATLVWYTNEKARANKIGVLCYMYWGASVMWFVDAIFEYIELRADFFLPETADMINDAFLGASVIALGMLIWVAILLIKDPSGLLKNSFKRG